MWIAGENGFVERWDGNRWHGFYVGRSTLDYVAGTAEDDLWFGGGALLWHWDGTQWTRERTPLPRSNAAHALATNDAWMVGDDGGVARWDGNAWTIVPSGTTEDLNGVWATATNDVWAVGRAGTVLRWQGTSWQPVSVPPSSETKTLLGVWAANATDVWIVPGAETGEVLRFQEGAFVSVPTSSTRPMISISGSSANDVWFAGLHNETAYWNGTTFQLFDHGANSADTVSAVSPSLAFIGARSGIFRWNGTQWESARNLATARNQLNTLWGSSTDLWAFGAGSQSVLRWNGTRWDYVSGPGNIRDAWGFADNDIWAVGDDIYHYDGAAWSLVHRPASWLTGVWGAAANDIWAVGGLGEIAHYDGSAWTPWPTRPTTENLAAITGVSATDIWVVGADGTLPSLERRRLVQAGVSDA